MKSNTVEETFNKKGKVQVRGWVEELRLFGGIKFIILRDRTGTIQITLPKKKVNSEVFDFVSTLTKESVVIIEGSLVENKEARGGKELIPSRIELVNKAEQPVPLNISGKVESSLDSRLDWRYLDMRRPEVLSIFKVQTTVSSAFREYFLSQGFIEIQPPCIISSASEGGANLYPVQYFEKQAFLAQSPQLYKQMCIAAGFDKVFMTVPVWRAEPHATTRHINEARQYDIEVAWASDQDALDYLENVVKFIFKEIKSKNKKEIDLLKIKLKIPKFHRITYTRAVDELNNAGLRMKWGDDFTPEGERKLSEVFGWDDFIFVYEFPTKIRAFYSMPKDERVCYGYDAIYKGLEMLSGATRIHLPNLLTERISANGLNPENFKYYIDAFRYGCPPHSGWSFGLERITMKILDLNNVREATMFPRDRNRLTP